MASKMVTIADVAKLAGVSLGTVSRVMNSRDGDIKISVKTRENVLQAAAALGYTPNPFASALRSKKTGIIGAVIRDINEPFLRKIIRDVQKECHERGLEMLIGHAAYELSTAERQMNMMMQHLFDGVFIVGNLPGDEKLLRQIHDKSVPAVSITGTASENVTHVDSDNIHGASLAMDHLLSLGHRRIAFLGNEEHAGVAERLHTYREFVRRHELPCPPGYLRRTVHSGGEAIVEAKALMRLPQPPTAMLCASDVLALGAMSGVWQLGCQIPRDVSIMGYDDIDEGGDSYPSLTTVRQPTDVMAREAMRLLTDRIGGGERAPGVAVKPELVVRGSCAGPGEAR